MSHMFDNNHIEPIAIMNVVPFKHRLASCSYQVRSDLTLRLAWSLVMTKGPHPTRPPTPTPTPSNSSWPPHFRFELRHNNWECGTMPRSSTRELAYSAATASGVSQD